METVYIKFLNGFIFRGAFNGFSYLNRLFLTSFIRQIGNQFLALFVTKRYLHIVYIGNFSVKGFMINLVG